MGIAHHVLIQVRELAGSADLSVLDRSANSWAARARLVVMSDYRRCFVAGATYFFTIVTYQRRPIFKSDHNVQLLRESVAAVKNEMPFTINAAVVLRDHLHFLWTLPADDDAYSKRIGHMKVKFTQSLESNATYVAQRRLSREKHRESDVWHRRFWEHVIRDETDFDRHFDYIHYNPVKHELASCPHAWKATSFHYWVGRGVYDQYWGCNCEGRTSPAPDFSDIDKQVGE